MLFLSFSELFPAFNRAKEIGNPPSIWLGVKMFNPLSFASLKSKIEESDLLSIVLFKDVFKNSLKQNQYFLSHYLFFFSQ